MADQQMSIPAGHICMTTHGSIRYESAHCWMESRILCERAGLQNVKWSMVPGTLPEKTRNEAVRQMLADPNAGWLLQIDADMTWEPNAILQLLQGAYATIPSADVMGAYCPLRGDLALPTIDSGTGAWESWFPGSGIIPVMRTGAAFLLAKRHVFEALKDPWFRVRVPHKPIDALLELDNFARTKFDGENPFRDLPSKAWERLERCAIDDPSVSQDQFTPAEVGEDSSFTDRVRNAGFSIYVHTDVVTGHVDTKIVDWRQHRTAMQDMERNTRLAAGLLK